MRNAVTMSAGNPVLSSRSVTGSVGLDPILSRPESCGNNPDIPLEVSMPPPTAEEKLVLADALSGTYVEMFLIALSLFAWASYFGASSGTAWCGRTGGEGRAHSSERSAGF
jgi:hypothetical protein